MHNEKQDWSKAYQQIATIILTEVPEVKHVDLYYGQERIVDGDGNWIPFKAPACFLQFDLVAQDLGELRQMLTVDIKVYVAFETVQDTHQGNIGQARALQFSALMRKLHQVLHNTEGDDFGPLSRVAMAREEGPPYWYFYSQTFRTVLLDYGATRNWTELGELDPEPAIGLRVNPMPPDDPAAQANSVRVRNRTGSYDEQVPAPGLHVLPNLTHIDSDGTPVEWPAMEPFTATPGGGGACAPASYQLRDSANNPIGSPGSIASGGHADITAPDAGVSVNGTQITTVKSNDAYDVAVKDFDGAPVGAWSDLLEAHVVGNAKVQVNTVDMITDLRPESQSNEVEVVDTNEVPIGSNVGNQWQIADSVLTKPDGTTMNLRAQQPFDIRTLRSGIAYAFGKLMWSGQSASYRAGDEGALHAAGWFDYVRPLYPLSYAELGADFYTLASNNLHGNTLRFTDRNGNAPATSGNRVIQDHLTGIEWYRPSSLPTAAGWNSAIDTSAASTVESNSDWWLPPFEVLYSIADLNLSDPFDHGGFGITSVLWTSTTVPTNTANAVRIGGLSSGPAQGTAKTGTNIFIYCRRLM